MKISEMNNEQATEAMIRLSAPLGNLCDDEKLLEIIKKYQKPEGMANIQLFGRAMPEVVTFAFKEHKNDLYEIVGALTQQTKAQVAKMNFIKTINVLKESYDDVLKDFFTSSRKRIQETVEESSQG